MNNCVTVNVTVGNYSTGNRYEVQEREKDQQHKYETMNRQDSKGLEQDCSPDAYFHYKLGPSLEDCLNELLLQDLMGDVNLPSGHARKAKGSATPQSECTNSGTTVKLNVKRNHTLREESENKMPNLQLDSLARSTKGQDTSETSVGGLIGRTISFDNDICPFDDKSNTRRTNNKLLCRNGRVLLFVKLLGGGREKTITLTDLTQDASIAAVKDIVFQQEGIPSENQRLILSGRRLNDDKTLRDYDIRYMTTLHLVVR